MPALAEAIRLVVALFVLNSAFTFHNLWPTPWPTLRAEVSPELVIGVLLLVLYKRWRPQPLPMSARAVLTAFAFAMTVGRYLEVSAPALFGRGINLYWDVRYLPDVARMLGEALPAGVLPVVIIGLLLGLVGIVATLALAIVWVDRALTARPAQAAAGLPAAALALAFLAGPAPVWTPAWLKFSLPLTRTYAHQVTLWQTAANMHKTADIDANPLPPSRLLAVPGDLHLWFFESYGSLVWDDADKRTALAPALAELRTAAVQGGWQVRSARVQSTTFGGYSWLAHSSLLSGLSIEDNGLYHVLLASKRDSMLDRLREAGFRTLGLMPGLKQPWHEGMYYGLDRLFTFPELSYHGPAYGWWGVPDQYSLDQVYRDEFQRADRPPLALWFTSITSHMPFAPVPPYLPGWASVPEPGTFPPPAGYSGPADVGAVYLQAMAYNFQLLGGYLSQRTRGDEVFVIMGDHQPPGVVSGPGRDWTVPVHVLTRDALLAERLSAQGFVEGFEPAADLGGMADLGRHLLTWFDAPLGPTGEPYLAHKDVAEADGTKVATP